MKLQPYPQGSNQKYTSSSLGIGLYHLDNKNMYIRMLFIYYSSVVFNTIILSKRVKSRELVSVPPYVIGSLSADHNQ